MTFLGFLEGDSMAFLLGKCILVYVRMPSFSSQEDTHLTVLGNILEILV